MGLDYTVFVGPYIEARPKLNISESKSEWGHCYNEKCSASDYNQKGVYCTYCAKRLTFPIEEIKSYASPWELNIDDALTEYSHGMDGNGDIHYFFANLDWKGATNSFDPIEDNVIYDCSTINIPEEITKFTEFFKEEIEIINKNYESFSIKWGIINTIS